MMDRDKVVKTIQHELNKEQNRIGTGGTVFGPACLS